jgi:arginine metabolism regulation protein II
MSTAGLRVAPDGPRKYSKTITGCWTCRSRKVKCDEARPACVQCSSKGLKCQGYGVRLRWMPLEQAFGSPSVDSSPHPSPRKPQRSHIALGACAPCPLSSLLSLLLLTLPADPHQHVLQYVEIDDILHSIDAFEATHSYRNGNDTLMVHNFGVFNSLAAGAGEAKPYANEGHASSPDSASCSIPEGLLSASPTYYEDASGIVGVNPYHSNSQFSNIAQPFPSDQEGTGSPHHPQAECLGPWQAPEEDMAGQVSSEEYNPRDEKRLCALPQHYQWQDASGAILRNPSPTYLSGLEQFLMYHYIRRVVRLFCVIDNDRSPWKTIHLPRALQSTGQLNVQGSSTRIRDSLRNALLSISAFYLANDSRSRMCQDEGARWTSEATFFRGKAIKLLKDAVNNDFQGSPPKYKEFLATMLSMISINVSKRPDIVVPPAQMNFI